MQSVVHSLHYVSKRNSMPTKKVETESALNPLEKFRKIFTELEPPKGGLPTMPTRIADMALDELGNMIARYTAWREFTEDRHMEACAVYSQCKSQYDLEVDKATLTATGDTITERKIEAKTRQHIEILGKKVDEAEIYVGLLAKKLESFSNVLAMLSRELTRRGVANM